MLPRLLSRCVSLPFESTPVLCLAHEHQLKQCCTRVCVSQVVHVEETPVGPPIGSTMFLLGLRKDHGAMSAQALLLDDAPEGGVCKPEV